MSGGRGPILLFGAAGQVGRNLMAVAQQRGIDIRGVTRAQADITQPDAVAAVVAQAQPRLVVNAAAYTAVDRAEREPALAHAVNAIGAENVARAAAAARAPVLHLSTDYVFDGSKDGAYVETDALAPLGVYGATKAEGEARLRAAHADSIVLRTAWVYGAYGSNFLKTMLRLAVSEPRLRVVADQHGCPTATADIAEAILAVDTALNAGSAARGVFHFAGTGVTSWHGFAEAIVACQAARTGKRPPVDAITTADYPTAARRPANSALDSGLFARTFGYRALPWDARMREAIDALAGAGGVPSTREGSS